MKAAITRSRSFAVLLALAMMAVLAFAEIAPASASSLGSAKLTNGLNVLPGSAQEFSILVRAASPVNAVRIDMPVNVNGIGISSESITPPSGWTATAQRSPTGRELIKFSGGPLLTGGSQTFSFPADVARPADRDLPGDFIVSLSSDDGQTYEKAEQDPEGGTLTSTVRILEVRDVSVTSPPLAADGDGSGGQDITVSTVVHNHALNAVTVTPSLSSREGRNAGSEEIGDPSPASASVAAGTESGFDFPVKLGPTPDGDRDITFIGGATAPNATGIGAATAYVVQEAPLLEDPDAFTPGVVKPGDAVDFTITVDKIGSPALDLESGTLTFAGTTADLQPVSVSEGDQDDVLLTFSGVVSGDDGTYDATFDLSGTDSNSAPFDQSFTLDDAIEIDAIAPVLNLDVTLPRDGDGSQQEASKSGDSIRVEGSIDDFRADIEFVELRSDAGDSIPVSVTRVPDPTSLDGDRFVGSATVDWSTGATSFRAVAAATDPAGNQGEGASEVLPVDDIAPVLASPGRTLRSDEIPGFEDSDSVPAVIEVLFDDAGPALVKGGCDESQWKVDGAQVVADVRNGDGSACTPREAGNDNSRLLVLSVPIDRDATPSVNYTPTVGDRAKDGAGNFVAQTVIDTVSGIAPAVPDIIEVFRNTSGETDCDPDEGRCEDAYNEDDEYFTRFGGDDTVVRFGGARSGYSVQVLDGDDQVLATESVAGSPADVRVPIGTIDGSYTRGLRLINARGIPGDIVRFTITLDTVAPAIADVTFGESVAGDSQATVTFTEALVEGTDFADDWFIVEQLDDGGEASYAPSRVQGSDETRVLTFEETGKGTPSHVEYFFWSDGERYRDRAGNILPDTVS